MPYLLPVGIGKRITVNTEQRNNTVKSRRKRCRQFVELLEWNHRRKAVAHSSDSGKGEPVMGNGGKRTRCFPTASSMFRSCLFSPSMVNETEAWGIINLPK